MRNQLMNIGGDNRHLFTAVFERTGTKSGWKGRKLETVLLLHVTDKDGIELTDHIWLNMTKEFKALDLEKGDVVSFEGRVALYEKGYKGYRAYYDPDFIASPIEEDYKITRPTKVQKIGHIEEGKTIE